MLTPLRSDVGKFVSASLGPRPDSRVANLQDDAESGVEKLSAELFPLQKQTFEP